MKKKIMKEKVVKKTTSKPTKKFKKELPPLEDATFLDKEGKKTKVVDVIDIKNDIWSLKDKWIITLQGTKKLARAAGISDNYDVSESQSITPNYSNELEHIVRVTIHCKANQKNGDPSVCVHSDERDHTKTGEANRINTPNRGRGYLRLMAEKRAYCIAVLEHLGLYSSLYSEDEAEDFKRMKEPAIMPGTKEFEAIVEEINWIINSKSIDELQTVGDKIKNNGKELLDSQKDFLREIFAKTYAKFVAAF